MASIDVGESTAADRAAADMRGGERATSHISQKSHDGFTVMAQTADKVVNGLFEWKKARKRQSNVE